MPPAVRCVQAPEKPSDVTAHASRDGRKDALGVDPSVKVRTRDQHTATDTDVGEGAAGSLYGPLDRFLTQPQ